MNCRRALFVMNLAVNWKIKCQLLGRVPGRLAARVTFSAIKYVLPALKQLMNWWEFVLG